MNPYDWHRDELDRHRRRALAVALRGVEVLAAALFGLGLLMLIAGLFSGWMLAVLGVAIYLTAHGLIRMETS
ncbi:MAG: hypothetical protein L0206_26380 [Actinobacteria bacterium]|nr:hypothetical protein [Actinomycetota bacterium]